MALVDNAEYRKRIHRMLLRCVFSMSQSLDFQIPAKKIWKLSGKPESFRELLSEMTIARVQRKTTGHYCECVLFMKNIRIYVMNILKIGQK